MEWRPFPSCLAMSNSTSCPEAKGKLGSVHRALTTNTWMCLAGYPTCRLHGYQPPCTTPTGSDIVLFPPPSQASYVIREVHSMTDTLGNVTLAWCSHRASSYQVISNYCTTRCDITQTLHNCQASSVSIGALDQSESVGSSLLLMHFVGRGS